MILSDEQATVLRQRLRDFDDARYGAMMKLWARVSDSPAKAGYLGLGLLVVGFVLGAWIF